MILRDLSARFRHSVIRFVEQLARASAPEPREIATARESIQRASSRRDTRAIGAALDDIRRARTEALRREVAAMTIPFYIEPTGGYDND